VSFEPIADAELPDRVALRNSVDQVPKGAREFQGHRAGIISRVLANSVDFVVMLIALVGGYIVWFAIDFILQAHTFKPPKPTLSIAMLGGFIFLFCYFTIAWATTGRTIGNVVLGLRVVNYRGNRVRWLLSALRAAFCIAFLPGLFWVIVSKSNRSVQDVVLRTSVIYDWTVKTSTTASPGTSVEP
jgi:uncharacterized RDD family membrane protein YckC